MLPELHLADSDKLVTLQKLDHYRRWQSLDEQRYCLGCRRLLNGHDIQIVGGTRGTGPLRLVCPTPRCPAIPMDWVQPTEEMLAQISPPSDVLATVRHSTRKVTPEESPGLRKSWRRLTARFRGAA